MKRVPIQQALTRFSEVLDEDISKNYLKYMRWALEAEKSIGSYYSFKRYAELVTISDNDDIDFPEDAIQVLSILDGDYTEEALRFYEDSDYNMIEFTESDYMDMPFADGHWWQGINYGYKEISIPFETEGWKIKTYPGYSGKEVTIQYWIFDKDDNGKILVNDSHIKPIAAYLEFMDSRKFMHRNFKGNKMTRANDIAYVDNLERIWARYAREAKAIDSEENSALEDERIRKHFTFPLIYNENM